MADLLTWRNVDAPNIDVRNLSIAGAGISDAFSRMAQMLTSRQEQKEKLATDAYVAGGLRFTDPNQLDTYIQNAGTGADGKLVNLRDALGALQTQRGSLITTAKAQDELLTQKAMSQLGDVGRQYDALLANGDRTGAAKLAADTAAANPDAWNRVAYGFGKDGEGLFHDWETNDLTRTRDKAQAAYQQGSLANDRARVGLEGQRVAMAREQFEQQQRDRAAERMAFKVGNDLGRSLDLANSEEDATTLVTRTPQWQNAQTQGERTALENAAKAAYHARTVATEAQLAGAGPTSGGVPSYLVPGDTSPNRIAADVASTKQRVGVATGAFNQSFLAAHPNLAITQKVASFGDKPVDFPAIVNYVKSNQLDISPETLQEAQQRGQLSNAELMALVQNMPLTNPSLFSMKGAQTFLQGAAKLGPVGAFTSGPYALSHASANALLQRATEYAKSRNGNQLGADQAELAQALRPMQTAQAALDKAEAKLRRQAAGGSVPQATRDEVDQLRADLEAMAAKVLRPQTDN